MSQEAITVSKMPFQSCNRNIQHQCQMEFLSIQDKTLVFFCFRLRCFNDEDVLRVERAQRNVVCSQVPKALVRRRFQQKS